MAPALIFRVEDRDGDGPHSSNYRDYDFVLDACRQPLPQRDDQMLSNEEMYSRIWRFGFSSMQELCYWFTVRDREHLRDQFKVSEIMVPPGCLRIGETQVAFLHGRLCGERPL
jgi:hypothetical protein